MKVYIHKESVGDTAIMLTTAASLIMASKWKPSQGGTSTQQEALNKDSKLLRYAQATWNTQTSRAKTTHRTCHSEAMSEENL